MPKKVVKKKISPISAPKKSVNTVLLSLVLLVLVSVLAIGVFMTQSLNTDVRSDAAGLKAGNQPARSEETYSYNLPVGQNFIAITLDTRTTAQTLCRNYSGISKVSSWNISTETWQEFSCATTGRQQNFPLRTNVAYLITATAPVELVIRGTQPVSYDIVFELGLNPVGVPHADDYDLQAEELCGNLVDSDLQVVEISRFVNSGWDTHLCSSYYNTPPTMNNYTVETGVGYLMKTAPQN